MTLRASVIVPAYNRPELLSKAIEALCDQSVPKKDFEIIIMYGKSAEVAKVCKKAAAQNKNLSCFACETESPARKRNIGIANAKGKIIAFTDDDCIPKKDWLEKILARFEKSPKIAGVEGETYTDTEFTGGKKLLYSNAPVNENGGLFPTCNMAFRKSVLDKIGGFDESFHFYREDSDIAFRAMELGNIGFCPEAKVLHPQRRVGLLRPIETLFLLKEDVRLFKKNPGRYWKYLGWAAIKEILKAAVSLAAAICAVYILALAPVFAILLAPAYLGFWHYMMRTKAEYTFLELFAFSSLTLLRNILYFPALIYYGLVIW